MKDLPRIASALHDKPVSRRAALMTLLAGALGAKYKTSFAAEAMAGMDHHPASFPDLGALPARPAKLRTLKLAWNENAICSAAIPTAAEKGIFARYGLAVDFVNFSGSTDQLLEAIASGKADGAVGMALRWLKPLEQGFDVKLVAGLHGGCARLLTNPASNIRSLSDLKGKVLGTSDLNSPDKAFFSIRLSQVGIDPNTDVTWRVLPGDLLPAALKRGDVAAIVGSDPLAWEFREKQGLQQLATNMDGEYAHRVCCVVGLQGKLVRNEPYIANALARSILEGGRIVAQDPEDAAAIFSSYTPKIPVTDLAAILREHAHHDQEIGHSLQSQVVAYSEELKKIGVFSNSLDVQRFSRQVTADPFAAA